MENIWRSYLEPKDEPVPEVPPNENPDVAATEEPNENPLVVAAVESFLTGVADALAVGKSVIFFYSLISTIVDIVLSRF